MSRIYICDRCGKWLQYNERYQIFVERIIDTKGENADSYGDEDLHDKDMCKKCVDRAIRMAFGYPAKVNSEFEHAFESVRMKTEKINEIDLEAEDDD